MFKRIKQMKDVVSETPDLLRNAQAMQANAQVAPPGLSSTMAAPTPTTAGSGGGAEPIAGVDLATYARISRALSDRGLDAAAAPAVAAEHGVGADAWRAAVSGWNARMQSDHGVAKQFNSMWRGAL